MTILKTRTLLIKMVLTTKRVWLHEAMLTVLLSMKFLVRCNFFVMSCNERCVMKLCKTCMSFHVAIAENEKTHAGQT